MIPLMVVVISPSS